MTTNAPRNFIPDGPDPLHPFGSYPIPSKAPPPKHPKKESINIDKLIGALDSLIMSVLDKAESSPDASNSDAMFYKELGKVAYAHEILPRLNLLKSYLCETEGYRELRRSYKTADGTLLEEYIEGTGSESKIVVYLDYIKQDKKFNDIFSELAPKD
jgi:hypothetical protein